MKRSAAVHIIALELKLIDSNSSAGGSRPASYFYADARNILSKLEQAGMRPPKQTRTGISQLDYPLKEGSTPNSTLVISSEPGSGKSLACQCQDISSKDQWDQE